ncbi:transporter substrate-binding domain-containing protein [Vibrio sp. JC009]|uniref:substrate-binding periplasmic protein n=1 Tax=Vibrio sp. JC009 TaxID=2912314 RepID=UPI0023AF9AD1|nr:transporter substrate-binding domain-containing protein [Vibrio sp. JC009]WED24634.1 transporter substrate-binding domain-containing protein [Vibrio sp. JC009]
MLRIRRAGVYSALLTSLFSVFEAVAEQSSATEPLVINNNHPEGSPAEVWMTKVYEDLYSRMNIPLKMVYFPKARGVFYADIGKIDGQVTSVYQYQEKQPDQMRIDFPLIKISMSAITRTDQNLQIKDWDSLKISDLRVEYLRGILIAEKKLTGRVSPANLTDSSNALHSLQKVQHNRIDVFVHGNITTFPLIQRDEFDGEIIDAGALSSNILYPYLSREHKDLVPIIESTLSDMRDDGSIYRYCVQAYGLNSHDFCNSVVPESL